MLNPSLDLLRESREHFTKVRNSFVQSDINFLLRRENFKDRLHGFLKRDYYQREKLFREGLIFFAYTFKKYLPRASEDEYFFTWALFSSELIFEKEPHLLGEITERLLSEYSNKKPKGREERQIYNALHEKISEPRYLLLPFELTEGHMVYLQFIEGFPDQVMNFQLGYNLIIALPGKSKEVFYLPKRYWSKNYKKNYEESPETPKE
ncbi:MAG: hypothetical protein ACOX3K_02015 [Bacilli bacterium]|jgi:hypothetical protein